MSNEIEDIFSAFEEFESREVDPPVPEGEQRYLPGFSRRGNPAPYTLQKAAKEYTEEALEVMVGLMRFSEEDSIKLDAAKQILDRGWGKPSVQIKAETIKYTLQDVEAKLLEHRDEIEAKVLEARKVEHERLARYIIDDAEIISDTAICGEGSLSDYS